MKDAYSDGSLVDEVMQLMLKALAHSGGKDPDVLEVLGVLYVGVLSISLVQLRHSKITIEHLHDTRNTHTQVQRFQRLRQCCKDIQGCFE